MRKPAQPLVRIYNAEEARDGWTSRHTVVEVTVEDMPFLVDSLGMVLTQAGLTIHMMVHPVLAVRRDRRGRLVELAERRPHATASSAASRGSTSRSTASATQQRLRSWSRSSCARSRTCRPPSPTGTTMRQRAVEVAQEIARQIRRRAGANEVHEIKALLEWMADNHFTFLGYRQYRLRRGRSEDLLEPLPETGLGHPARAPRLAGRADVLTGELRERARQPELLTITKANSMSTVHRATYLDYVGVKTFDSAGRVTGEKRFLGLFTSAVYNRSPREIPLLRHKIERVVAHFGLDPASHDGKAVVHVLETYPRDELFQSSVPELIRTVRGIVNLYERQRVRVFLRRDAFGRFYSALDLRAARPLQHAGPPADRGVITRAAARDDDRIAGAAVRLGAGTRAHDHPRAGRQPAIASMPTRSSS